MARVLTTKDAYQIINLLVKEATGQDATIQAVDPSTFVSVGETVLASGVENTLNALSMVLGRTFMAVRPYDAKLNILNSIDSGLYSNRMRKISFYSREAVVDGAENTDLKTNFAEGYDNGINGGASAPSMWEQQPSMPWEVNFAGSSEWQLVQTVYEKQLQVAFRGPEEFAAFVNGMMVEKANEIEMTKEAFNRMTLLNAMAGVYDLSTYMTGSSVNLTTECNNFYGFSPAKTTAELLSTDLTLFLEFLTSYIKILSDQMTNNSKRLHWAPIKTVGGNTYTVLRHTPKDRQKLIIYKPFWYRAESMVKPAIFNERYLDFGNFEGVDFWQNENDPSAIDVTPAIPDVAGSNSGAQTVGTRVQLDYVLGFMFDEDGLMTDFQYESSDSTVLESRKKYRNIWYTFRKNAITDFSEKMVLLYMDDSGI